MNLFQRLFAPDVKNEEPAGLPEFGRYSDNNKNAEQLKEWAEAKKKFDAKNYVASVEHFFIYLRDVEKENVIFESLNNQYTFKIYQGSTVIHGFLDETCVRAEVAIARMDKASVPAMRRLLEKNFELFYCKFYLEENSIKLKIYNNITAAAPSKLYYSLKELALQADRLDDILTADFDSLRLEGEANITPNAPEIKNIKYQFFKNWTEKTVAKVDSLDPNIFSAGITYLLLNLVYKLDYLLLPEGKLTEKLEQINSIFWGQAKDTPATFRNEQMLEAVRELSQWSEAEVKNCFYCTKHTFALTKPAEFGHVVETIKNTFKNTVWYQQNNHPDIVLEMLEYALGYSQFSFSLPRPISQLFDVMMRVLYVDYYESMGYDNRWVDGATGQLNIESIKGKLHRINEQHKTRYAHFFIDADKLDFENPQSFLVSLLTQIINLNLQPNK